MADIDELLTRGVDSIYPSKEALEKLLKNGKKLKLYQGFDPTGTQLHIGHMVGLRKLSQWQKLGHHVIFLIGDGTGQAGDPSGKTRTRDKFLSQDQLRQNAKDYVLQARKLIDFDATNVEILYNGDWLNDLSLPDILEIAGNFTWQQFAERDLFQERIKNKEPILLREAMYPLLQAYDSVAMDVDLELGGTDQTFNMLMGRSLMRAMKNKDKFVMTTPLLTDSAGNKIGKTEGNVIALSDEPIDLYRKIMALSDEIVVKGLEYLTDLPMEEVNSIGEKIKKGDNPLQYKKKLAYEVVRQLSSDQGAAESEVEFERVVQKGDLSALPLNNLQWTPISGASVSNVMANELHVFGSVSEAKRTISQGGVTIAGEIIKDPNAEFSKLLSEENIELVIGKKRRYNIKKNG